MKTLLTLFIAALLAVGADAQTVEQSQKRAVAKFPDLARKGSEFHKRFFSELDLLKRESPWRLDSPNWPMALADDVKKLMDDQVNTARVGDLEVFSQIVKRRVGAGIFGGEAIQYRYFFSARNVGKEEFYGIVRIGLGAELRKPNVTDDIRIRLLPGQSKGFYLDAYTGSQRRDFDTEALHRFNVLSNGEDAWAEVNPKTEDLAAMQGK